MMATSDQWLHFHHQDNPSAGQVAPSHAATSASDLLFWPGGPTSESTVVSTTPTAANPAHGGQTQLGPEGRLSKPARRRTRASRRTPTTLLNTDTTNFRAMVQQFTGGPSSAFAPGPVGNSGFSMLGPHGFGLAQPNRTQMVSGPGPAYGLQFPLAQQQQPLQPYVASNNNTNNNNNRNLGELFMNSGNNVNVNNVNVRSMAGGTGGGSSSSENRSSSNNTNGTSTTGFHQF